MHYVNLVFGWLLHVWNDVFAEHPTEWLLAVFTGLLVLYTRRLYVATKALASADRPHLVPTTFEVANLDAAPNAQGEVTATLHFRFSNYGKSPAFVTRFSTILLWTDSLEADLPANPPYEPPRSTRHIIAPQGWYGSGAPGNITVQQATAASVMGGARQLTIAGYIEYHSFGGEQYKIRFAFSFDFAGGPKSTRYFPVGPDSYWEYV
jgi:hypothetical protein